MLPSFSDCFVYCNFQYMVNNENTRNAPSIYITILQLCSCFRTSNDEENKDYNSVSIVCDEISAYLEDIVY